MNESEPIYLDYAATTPLLPEVAEAVREAMLATSGNASSQHAPGRAARRVLEDARERIAELLGAAPGDRLLLTSGGTEANNHALRGALPPGGRLITSAIEHPSIANLAHQLAAEGHSIARLPAETTGVTNLDELPNLLRGAAPGLVSLMLANSETGVLQPIEQATALASEAGAIVHTDATQAIGRHAVDFQQLGVAMMTFAAHKFHGPPGIGGLLVRGDCHPKPLLAGQAEEERPGTPPVGLVVGMLRALEIAMADLHDRVAHIAKLRNRFEHGIRDKVPATVIIGAGAARLPHISSIAFVGLDRQALLMALDRAGIACSTGSACASGSSEPSPVLTAMDLPTEQIDGALRFSFGAPTSTAEVDEAVARIRAVCQRFCGGKEG